MYSHIREVYEKVRKTESYELTDEEMNVVKQHPLVGAAMTQRFPEGITTKKLNKYSYEICRHHHDEPEEAIRMISNGECGAFSKKLIQCLTAAAKQPEWLKVTKSQA